MAISNAVLAQNMSDLIDFWSTFNEEYKTWLSGTITGGPGSDGYYVLTDYTGQISLIACPALLADNVSGYVGQASGSATAAAASALAASNSETAAAASAVTATAQAALADADRIAAQLAESGAVDAKVTAIAQAAAAAVSAANALASEVAALAAQVAAEAAQAAAEAANITHTGEVTGDTILTLDVTAITNKTNVEADSVDSTIIVDATDGALKKTLLNSITDGGYF